MNRRGFLGSILALGAAPAVVRAENIMRLWVPREPTTWIDASLIQAGTITADKMRLYYDGEQWEPHVIAAMMRGPSQVILMNSIGCVEFYPRPGEIVTLR
jgi:hypothetical protein